MRSWYLAPVVVAHLALGQNAKPKVFHAEVLHYQSRQAGPFQPLVQMSFGTPPQSITGIFDSGSSDIIVPRAGSEVCQQQNQQCRNSKLLNLGDFDPSKSRDVQNIRGSTLSASFSGGDTFDGPFVKTTVKVGGASVAGAQVAVAENGQVQGDFPQFAIFGFGPTESEQTKQKYGNLLTRMKETGAISKHVFSVLLNPTPMGKGTVVIGGIDTAKFKGDLQAVALSPSKTGKIVDFVVTMTSVNLVMKGQQPKRRSLQRRRITAGSTWNKKRYFRTSRIGTSGVSQYGHANGDVNGNGNNKNNEPSGQNKDTGKGKGSGGKSKNLGKTNKGNQNNNNNGKKTGGNAGSTGNSINLGLSKEDASTLFDTGGVGITLPVSVVEKLADALKTDFDLNHGGIANVDCAVVRDTRNQLVFGFNDDKIKVSVPLSHIAISNDVQDEEEREAGRCALGLELKDSESKRNSMGFPFFSSVYTVFDLEKNRMLFAEAVHDAKTSNLKEFP